MGNYFSFNKQNLDKLKEQKEKYNNYNYVIEEYRHKINNKHNLLVNEPLLTKIETKKYKNLLDTIYE